MSDNNNSRHRHSIPVEMSPQESLYYLEAEEKSTNHVYQTSKDLNSPFSSNFKSIQPSHIDQEYNGNIEKNKSPDVYQISIDVYQINEKDNLLKTDVYQYGQKEDKLKINQISENTVPYKTRNIRNEYENCDKEENYGYHKIEESKEENLNEKKEEKKKKEECIKKVNSSIESLSYLLDLNQTTQYNFSDSENWNNRYEFLLKLPPSLEKDKSILQLFEDFEYTATLYSKIIINEFFLENEKKTIKPLKIGGIAGGEKYVIRDILFKFSLDIFKIYGSHENAMKAANAELKGVATIHNSEIENLSAPFMCNIDYKGFRIICVSLLPISEKTFVIGSSNGGNTFFQKSKEANEKMEILSKKLNLISHETLKGDWSFGPIDLEVHQVDETFYCIDCARLFPPEKPQNFLTEFLRPEYIQTSPIPFSSDSFSRFQKKTPKNIENDQNLKNFSEKIPNYIDQIVSNFIKTPEYKNTNFPQDYIQNEEDISVLKQLILFIHSKGINIRYLGILRNSFLKLEQNEKNYSTRILIEMISRVLKNLMRAKWRNLTKEQKNTQSYSYLLIWCDLINNLVSGNIQYWNIIQKMILLKFGELSLTENEKKNGIEQTNLAFIEYIILRAELVLGIKRKESWEEYGIADFDEFPKFDITNFDELKAITTGLPNQHLAKSRLLFSLAKETIDHFRFKKQCVVINQEFAKAKTLLHTPSAIRQELEIQIGIFFKYLKDWPKNASNVDEILALFENPLIKNELSIQKLHFEFLSTYLFFAKQKSYSFLNKQKERAQKEIDSLLLEFEKQSKDLFISQIQDWNLSFFLTPTILNISKKYYFELSKKIEIFKDPINNSILSEDEIYQAFEIGIFNSLTHFSLHLSTKMNFDNFYSKIFQKHPDFLQTIKTLNLSQIEITSDSQHFYPQNLQKIQDQSPNLVSFILPNYNLLEFSNLKTSENFKIPPSPSFFNFFKHIEGSEKSENYLSPETASLSFFKNFQNIYISSWDSIYIFNLKCELLGKIEKIPLESGELSVAPISEKVLVVTTGNDEKVTIYKTNQDNFKNQWQTLVTKKFNNYVSFLQVMDKKIFIISGKTLYICDISQNPNLDIKHRISLKDTLAVPVESGSNSWFLEENFLLYTFDNVFGWGKISWKHNDFQNIEFEKNRLRYLSTSDSNAIVYSKRLDRYAFILGSNRVFIYQNSQMLKCVSYNSVNSLQVFEDILLTSQPNGIIELYDFESLKLIHTFEEHSSLIHIRMICGILYLTLKDEKHIFLKIKSPSYLFNLIIDQNFEKISKYISSFPQSLQESTFSFFSPLHVAVSLFPGNSNQDNLLRIIDLLIKKGVDLNKKTNSQKTVLDFAKEYKDSRLLNIFSKE